MSKKKRDTIEHVAISVKNVAEAVDWYTRNFNCVVSYQDATWAVVDFENIQLAFVVPGQHPPHIAIPKEKADSYGKLKLHRDGTRSVYIKDPSGNDIELMEID